MPIGRSRRAALVVLAISCLVVTNAAAQSPPVDLADLSLSELLEVEFIHTKESDGQSWVQGWRFSYDYVRVKFKGYRDGTSHVSKSKIFAAGKYKILPTKIIQQAHIFNLAYELREGTAIAASLPYIRQETDHVSDGFSSAFDQFTINSDGIGDVSLTATQRLYRRQSHVFSGQLGLSFPTGSINKRGDTPGPGSSNPLPYTMQLGSGSWDIIVGGSYRGAADAPDAAGWLGALGWGLELNGKIRTARNDRHYRLGDRLTVRSDVSANPFSWLRARAELSGEVWGRIVGEDPRIKGAPAPVADNNLFGGEKIILAGALDLGWPQGWLSDGMQKALGGQRLSFEFGWPVYQRLNGPQPEEDWRLRAGLNWHF